MTNSRFICCLFFFAGLGAIVAFYSFFLFNTQIIPGAFPDTWVTLWSLNWVRSWVNGLHDNLYFTPYLFAPSGTSLLLHNLTESMGFLSCLLSENVPLHQVYCWLVLLVLILNYMCAWLLFRSSNTHISLCTILACTITVHPYIVGHIAGGHLNLFATFPLLLQWLLFSKKARSYSTLHHTILQSFIIFIACYTDFYLTYFIFLTLSLYSLVNIFSKNASLFIKKTLPGLVIGSALSLPKFLPAAQLMWSRTYTSNHNPALHSLDLAHIFIPGEYQFAHSQYFLNLRTLLPLNSAECGGMLMGTGIIVFIGILLSIFEKQVIRLFPNLRCNNEIIGVASPSSHEYSSRSPLQLHGWFGLFFLLLALGPTIHLFNQPVAPNILYNALSYLPGFPSVPARFTLPFLIATFLCIAQWQLVLPKAISFGGVLLLLLEATPTALPFVTVTHSQALTDLSLINPTALVYDAGAAELVTYRQMLHGHPVVNGFVARRPKSSERLLRKNRLKMFLEGKEITDKQLVDSHLKDGITYVIVDTFRSEIIQRLLSHRRFRKILEDSSLMIFEVSAHDREYAQ